MRCPGCKTENPEGAQFCIQCASPLKRACQKCGCENPPEARFCAQCGASLEVPASIRAGAEPRNGGLTGERRHLTVLFCDLVGSTALAAQLDPEEWRAIVADYHRAVGQAAERFGGYVAQYLGDGVMAFFGYPEAHDNDAERAARAGLAILEEIRNSTSNLNDLDSPHASGSIQARSWWARVPARRRTSLATCRISLRACRTRRIRTP